VILTKRTAGRARRRIAAENLGEAAGPGEFRDGDDTAEEGKIRSGSRSQHFNFRALKFNEITTGWIYRVKEKLKIEMEDGG